MKKINISIALICLFCMSSCVYSLFPIYTEDTVVYLPELNGTYQDGNTTVTFAPGSDIEITSLEVTSDNPDEYYVSNGDTIRDMKLITEAIMEEFEQDLVDNAKFYKMTVMDKNHLILAGKQRYLLYKLGIENRHMNSYRTSRLERLIY
ncbi:MAG: hypothetical protein AAFN93_16800 [Bacteroidota bacterium]